MTSHDQSPRAFAAAVVLLAALLLISRLIIERAPAREWSVALLLLALGIGLLLWDSYARRSLSYQSDQDGVLQSDRVIREYLPPASPTSLIAPEPTSTMRSEPVAAETDIPVDAPAETTSAAGSIHTGADPASTIDRTAAEAALPVEVEPPAAPESTSTPDRTATADDDLTIIEGIGPKISAALVAAGIRTYADLAAASEAQIREILSQAHLRVVGSVSTSIPTWPEQAALAAAGRFDALKAWQVEHKMTKR